MKHVQLMMKPASSNCNLRCAYCFYEDECKNREIPSYGIMKEAVLETVVRKALEAAEESCTFGFQGGEPTLAGLEFFEKFIAFTKKYKKPETKLYFCLQTNGTLLDEKWTEFLREKSFSGGNFFGWDQRNSRQKTGRTPVGRALSRKILKEMQKKSARRTM